MALSRKGFCNTCFKNPCTCILRCDRPTGCSSCHTNPCRCRPVEVVNTCSSCWSDPCRCSFTRPVDNCNRCYRNPCCCDQRVDNCNTCRSDPCCCKDPGRIGRCEPPIEPSFSWELAQFPISNIPTPFPNPQALVVAGSGALTDAVFVTYDTQITSGLKCFSSIFSLIYSPTLNGYCATVNPCASKTPVCKVFGIINYTTFANNVPTTSILQAREVIIAANQATPAYLYFFALPGTTAPAPSTATFHLSITFTNV